jgi:hypothetical protein
MKRIAMIEDGQVVNIAMWDGETLWNVGDEFTLIDVTDRPEIGKEWSYDGSTFFPPQQSEG